jgi:hypothetical protein
MKKKKKKKKNYIGGWKDIYSMDLETMVVEQMNKTVWYIDITILNAIIICPI